MSVNVCSLMSKIDDISSFILGLVNNNIDIKIVAVQEIWSLPHPDLVNIPGYFYLKREKILRGVEWHFLLKTVSHAQLLII